MSNSKPGQLHPSWHAMIGDEPHKPNMESLRNFLTQEKAATWGGYKETRVLLKQLDTQVSLTG